MVTDMDNVQSHGEPSSASNKNVDDFAAQMATTTEVEVESIVSSVSDESAASQGRVDVPLSSESDSVSSRETPTGSGQTRRNDFRCFRSMRTVWLKMHNYDGKPNWFVLQNLHLVFS